MVRRILILLVFALAVGGLAYLVNYYQRARKPVRKAIDCIPSGAVFILESRQVKPVCQKLREGNQMWGELLSIPQISELQNTFLIADSLLEEHAAVAEMLNGSPLYASLHLRTEVQTAFLFSFALPEMNKDLVVTELFRSSGSINENTEEGFNGITIYKVKFRQSNMPFFYSFNQGVFSGSFSKAMVNEALIHSEAGKVLTDDPAFEHVFRSAGERSDGNIYIRNAGIGSLINAYQNTEEEEVGYLSDFGAWTALDISFRTNLLIFNGYGSSRSADKDRLSLFNHQEPQDLSILNAIPAGAAEVIAFGVGDLETYIERNKRMQMNRGESGELETITRSLMDDFGIDPQESFLGWSNNRFAGFQMTGNSQEEVFFCGVFYTPDEAGAKNTLFRLVRKIDSLHKEKTDSVLFSGTAIYSLQCENPIGKILGAPFHLLKQTCYSIYGQHVYFTSSPGEMMKILEELMRSKTLAKHPGFRNFFDDNFTPESNLFLYCSVPASLSSLINIFGDDQREFLNKHKESFKNFDAFAFQISSDDDLYYCTSMLRYNPANKKEISTLLES